MICSNCQQENASSAKFCSECGTKLQAVCPQCGAAVTGTARFCSECGAALTAGAPPPAPASPPTLEAQFASLQQALPASLHEHLLTQAEGENRIVTVLFADMSGSVATTSQLQAEDAAALVNNLLKAMVDALLKYEGRVDHFLGDGVLALFGVPQAHESDPERAILAAMEIRTAAQQLGLQVTAGINTGEVYLGGIGSERHQEVTVMGPAVNLASRLQGQAEPGQILVGEVTHRQTQRAFEFSPLSLQVKGIAEPVTAYLVERALPRPEKVRGIEGLRAELVGRDEEFAKLQEALAEVQSGRGQMVSLIGEAGVGKSRLVAELRQGVGGRVSGVGSDPSDPSDPTPFTPHPTPLWLEGRCLELGMTASYWLFVDLFRDYFAWRPEEEDRSRGERLVACLREFVARGDLSEARFAEMGPLLGNLLSLRFGTDWDDRLKHAGPEQIKHQTFLAVHDFFVALARQRPVVLVLEDLHWADSLSLDLISLLMEALRLAPLLLLCVYRPEREHKCWHLATIASRKCPERYTELSLRELTPPQSRRLVESLLAVDDLPGSVRELILEKSHGNPFFVEEVIRSLIDSGMIRREGETWRAKEGIEQVAVPESVQSVILSRVDRLGRELKRVLESASVIGRLFRRRLLAYTMKEATELEKALWELEDRWLIYQERVVPEEEYSFKHVLTQETIYGSILRRHRTVFHQRVAEAMEALYQEGLEEYYEQLAYHYERSGADEKAIKYLLKAGEKARQTCLYEEAIGYFRRALERLDRSVLCPSAQEQRLEALKGLGQVYWAAGDNVAAEAHLQQAIAVGKEIGLAPRALVRLYAWLAETMYWLNRHDDRKSIGEEGLALLGDDLASAEAAWMMSHIAAGAWHGQGDEESWRKYNNRNAAIIEAVPYSEELRPAYVHLYHMYAWEEKNTDEALRWIHALARRAQQHHDIRTAEEVHLYEAMILAARGDLQGVISLQQHLERCKSIGEAHLTGWWHLVLSNAFLRLGDLERSLAHAETGYRGAEHRRSRQYIGWWPRRIGTLSLCRGSSDEAGDMLRRASETFRETGNRWGEAQSAHCLGRLHLAQGERGEARRCFEAAVSVTAHPSIEALSGLEEAYEDPEAFRAFCHHFRDEHPEVSTSPFVQWHLQPTEPFAFSQCRLHDEFATTLSSVWVWRDPFADCQHTGQRGLEIHAANARDLWHLNLSAPRLLQPAAGDFAIQTICIPAHADRPAIGGLLLWKDKENFLRLERGTRGPHEISFMGCLENKDVTIGRGRLPSERIFLRLERIGSRVNALCSADGQAWFTVGHAAFPAEVPVEVGVHAIGSIDRTIYHGAYAEGTAIRFESFDVWS